VQIVPLSRLGHGARPQPIGYAGLMSCPAKVDGSHRSTAADTVSQADFTEGEQAGAGQMHFGRRDPMSRLPFGDALALAALVGTGRMSWQEINAALAARMKLAAADEIRRRTESDGQCGGNVDACTEWGEAKRAAESEIWARYHAQCDTVFADHCDPMDIDSQSLELLFRRERILDRFRNARDRALANLGERLGPGPFASAQSNPAQAALLRTRLSAAESAALGRLNETGFSESEQMREAIKKLAVETADTRLKSGRC
jgi:hypothetical protein